MKSQLPHKVQHKVQNTNSTYKGESKMKEEVKENTLKPVLHGILLKDRKFLSPTKIKILERFGIISLSKCTA